MRDDLRLMLDAVLPCSQAAVALEGVCEHYRLPALDAQLVPKVAAAVLAVEAALTAYEEFCESAKAGPDIRAGGEADPAAINKDSLPVLKAAA
ncbi:MAG: hypothetical protein ACREF4_21995 [Gammaproteobacteria bacterium]